MNSIARRTSVLFFFILGLTSAFAAGQAKPTPDLPLAQAPATGRVMETYGKMPLSFEANQGQTDPRVKFLSRGSGYTLFLTPTEAVLALQKPGRPEGTRPGLPAKPGSKSPDGKQPRLGVADAAVRPSSPAMVLRMKLVGGNRAAKIGGADELPGRSNYFIGKDPAKWRTNVSNYGKVQYRNVYPGVDLVYYGNQRQLEHDFVVAPGSDPKVIKLAFEGAKNISLNSTGDLVMGAREGEIQLKHPRVYQEVDGKRQEVAARYMLTGKGRVGFAVAQYDHRQPLVIDPVLSYSTYLGGSSEDVGLGIAVDSSGNAYVTGYTASTDFPTVNSLQATFGGGYHDAFVAKLNAAGSTLSYSTYLGGSSDDYGIGIAVDSSGNAYITGLTSSTDFPTVNSLQATFGGGYYDAFVAKLNAAGSTLSYSTYLGGSSDENAHGIAVDSSGNAYVTGLTSSTDFPTANAVQASNGGGNYDAFVAKLNAAGSTLSYSTYLGGSAYDFAQGIAVDSSGNAYITGVTLSTDFPTANAVQASYGGSYDGFVAKLNAAGSTLSYSTYLGGSSDDYGIGIAVDSSGNAYVTGLTSSTAFPTVNSLQATFGGGSYDGFVAKLNAAGSTLSYSTYLGGSSDEYGYGIAVDSSGNAYVTGLTGSTDFPTVNPLQASYGGGLDAFVAKIDGFVTTAASQSASTNEDTAKAITLSGSSANSCEITFSIVSSPSHGTLSALTDNACAAGSPNTDTANVTYSPAANYNGADSFTFKVNDGTTDSAAATVSLTVYPVNDAPSLSTPGNQTVITGNTLNLSLAATDVETPAAGLQYSSASLPSGATLSSAGAFSWTPTATQVGSYTVTFTVTDVGDPDGCTGALPACSAPLSDSKTITIKVIALQTISVTPVAPSLRKGFTLQFTATGAYSDASARNITSSVAWTSSKTSVATISAGGLALGIAPGKSTIKATSGSISGSTVLTVTSAQKPTR